MSFWKTLAKIGGDIGGSFIGDPMLGNQVMGALDAFGGATGKATSAAGNNRLNQQQLALQANRDNITGNHTAESEMMDRAALENKQRHQALVDVLRMSDTKNPHRSPEASYAPRTYSENYMTALSELEKRGLSRLQQDPMYGTDKMAALKGYQPLDIKNLQAATGTQPGKLEKIGNWLGPIASIASKLKFGQDDNSDYEPGGSSFVGPMNN